MDQIPVVGIIFSRDRAMQLHALISSLYLNCVDAIQMGFHVIYKTTTQFHSSQYARLQQELSIYPNLHFVKQRKFRRDLLALLIRHSGLSETREILYFAAIHLPYRLSAMANLVYRESPKFNVLFIVDDNLFVRPFQMRHVLDALEMEDNALGFSLRLGSNTTFCYTSDRPQAIPQFWPVRTGIEKFNWGRAEFDFNYPLEISSSVYRMDQILPLINRLNFNNPNKLESRMAGKAHRFYMSHPELLCFEKSVAFCNPINIVQNSEPNRVGQKVGYTTQFLAQKFEMGHRIDVSKYQGFTPASCHQEIELIFMDSN